MGDENFKNHLITKHFFPNRFPPWGLLEGKSLPWYWEEKKADFEGPVSSLFVITLFEQWMDQHIQNQDTNGNCLCLP